MVSLKIQVNYARGKCGLDGTLQHVVRQCYSDELLFRDLFSDRPQATVLDVGCNTGKNMTRAIRYGGPGVQAYGIEFNEDSVALAQEVHGKDHVYQGDASKDFVLDFSWQEKFSVAICTAVIQVICSPESY